MHVSVICQDIFETFVSVQETMEVTELFWDYLDNFGDFAQIRNLNILCVNLGYMIYLETFSPFWMFGLLQKLFNKFPIPGIFWDISMI